MKRTPTRKRATRRDWTEAIEKVHDEHECRYCGRDSGFILWSSTGRKGYMRLEAAHVLGRGYQDELRVGPRGGQYFWPPPEAVVTLCSECHRLYDARKISLVGLLTLAEYRNAYRTAKRYGIDFRRRISGERRAV